MRRPGDFHPGSLRVRAVELAQRCDDLLAHAVAERARDAGAVLLAQRRDAGGGVELRSALGQQVEAALEAREVHAAIAAFQQLREHRLGRALL